MSNTEDEALSRVGWLKALLMALEDVSRGHEALYDEVNGLARALIWAESDTADAPRTRKSKRRGG